MELLRYATDKLAEPGFWALVLVVGLAINVYGQVIVPYLRDVRPIDAFRGEARQRPRLLVLSICIAFVFPFLVALSSGVATRYGQREVERRASFPDEKPDPVFRVDEEGAFVRMGRSTRELLDVHPAGSAVDMLGADAWDRVLKAHREGRPLGEDIQVEFGGERYLVAYSSSADGAYINLYMAHILGEVCGPAGP